MEAEHGESFIRELATLFDKRQQRQIMQNFQMANERFQQIDAALGAVQENSLRDEAALFDQQVRGLGHPDWQSLRASQGFYDWCLSHPLGGMYWSMVMPQQPGEGGDSAQVARILDEYKAQNPALQAAAQRDLEAAQRAAAAAQSNRGAMPVGAEIPAATPADYLTVSDLGNQIRQHANNPTQLKEIRRRMDATIAQNRLVDNMGGRLPAGFHGGVVP